MPNCAPGTCSQIVQIIFPVKKLILYFSAGNWIFCISIWFLKLRFRISTILISNMHATSHKTICKKECEICLNYKHFHWRRAFVGRFWSWHILGSLKSPFHSAFLDNTPWRVGTLLGTSMWGIWPGTDLGSTSTSDEIAWRKEIRLVESVQQMRCPQRWDFAWIVQCLL